MTSRDFTIDTHNTGRIIGNGQCWWNWYGTTSWYDGDGRPIAFTLRRVLRHVVGSATCTEDAQAGLLIGIAGPEPKDKGSEIYVDHAEDEELEEKSRPG
ncbi:uncharacterized protein C8Q71DRAFT_856491 [Rhodofomes roseus]|uniref:Uncharacterized protein n=1 Tax=Rhodofomes roseus TaxID=34475 RepID=A0ABQ8KK99_9APHY|nr:uncharacterized protein C8Q71DRAFT_856491 [Rhodofomes roseus]KAH9838552.1 hypothetical protein C8Q71DRAFT_856491 [Rhodofomes roseus]